MKTGFKKACLAIACVIVKLEVTAIDFNGNVSLHDNKWSVLAFYSVMHLRLKLWNGEARNSKVVKGWYLSFVLFWLWKCLFSFLAKGMKTVSREISLLRSIRSTVIWLKGEHNQFPIEISRVHSSRTLHRSMESSNQTGPLQTTIYVLLGHTRSSCSCT